MSRFADNELLWLIESTTTEDLGDKLMDSIYIFNLLVLRSAFDGLELLHQHLQDPKSAASTTETGAPSTLSGNYFNACTPLILALQRVKSIKDAFDCKPERIEYATIGNWADNCRFPDISSLRLPGPSGKASLRLTQLEQLVTALKNASNTLNLVTVVRTLPKKPRG